MSVSIAPKVSVIIPVHNVALYLRECMDSVINQTLKDIEIICVDDGSTDHSLDIFYEYAATDNRIIILARTAQGVSAARNAVVETAHGKYLYFLDSDDYIEINALEYLYYEAEKYNLDILYFDGESFYESEEMKQRFGHDDVCYRAYEYSDIYSGEELYVRMRQDDAFRTMIWTMLIRHEYYRDMKLSFCEGILHEDVLFTLQCVLQAKRVSHRKQVFYHYRRRVGSITTDDFPMKRLHGKLFVMTKLVQLMDEYTSAETTRLHLKQYLLWLWTAMKKEYGTLGLQAEQALSEWIMKEPFSVQMMYEVLKQESRAEFPLLGRNNNVSASGKIGKVVKSLKAYGVKGTLYKIRKKLFG